MDERALIHTQEEVNRLHTGCDPVTHTRVAEYLSMTEGPDAMLINAWRRCGRSDRTRTVRIDMGATARSTMSALGTACLLAYCQAWLDECEARVATERKQACPQAK